VTPAIHALCIVKNEADVISECLISAKHWCDRIYVFDNGSDDGTWEIVQELAARVPEVVPFKQDPAPFHDGLRAEIFNAFRAEAAEEDWWCLLGADEFYVDDPRVFLAKVSRQDGVVWSGSFSYFFTDRDAEAYRSAPEVFESMPVDERLRYYLYHWGEVRFFRHRDDLSWSSSDGVLPPCVRGWHAYPVRIWVKHFPYRSPAQIEKRLLTRLPAIRAGEFVHEAVDDWASTVGTIPERRTQPASVNRNPELGWTTRIIDATKLHFDALDRRFEVDESLLPPIPQPRSRARRLLDGIVTPIRRSTKS
jgi:hypothetical protein